MLGGGDSKITVIDFLSRIATAQETDEVEFTFDDPLGDGEAPDVEPDGTARPAPGPEASPATRRPAPADAAPAPAPAEESPDGTKIKSPSWADASFAFGNHDTHSLSLSATWAMYTFHFRSKPDHYELTYEIGEGDNKAKRTVKGKSEDLERVSRDVTAAGGTVKETEKFLKATQGLDVGASGSWSNEYAGPKYEPLARLFSSKRGIAGGGDTSLSYYGFARFFSDDPEKPLGPFHRASTTLNVGVVETGGMGAASAASALGASLNTSGSIGFGVPLDLKKPEGEAGDTEGALAARVAAFDEAVKKAKDGDRPYQLIPSLLVYYGKTPAGHSAIEDLRYPENEVEGTIMGATLGAAFSAQVSKQVTLSFPVRAEISSTDPSEEEEAGGSKGSEGIAFQGGAGVTWEVHREVEKDGEKKEEKLFNLTASGKATHINKGPKEREEEQPYQKYSVSVAADKFEGVLAGLSASVGYDLTDNFDIEKTITVSGNGQGGTGTAGSLGAPAGKKSERDITFTETPHQVTVKAGYDIMDHVNLGAKYVYGMYVREPIGTDTLHVGELNLTLSF